jgi:hypothetical protein
MKYIQVHVVLQDLNKLKKVIEIIELIRREKIVTRT